MANGDQVQGGGGGQRTYSEEDVMALMNETARRAATEAMKNTPKRDEDEDDTPSVINPKVVKQLKDTVAVFTALKDLSSNPLQKTIEETVGGMAASVVQSAFAPRGPPPKQDIIDKLLNSQFAYGLGSGMGQRAPELVETMGKTFGKEKAGQMMDNIIGKYGTGGGQSGPSRQLSPGPSSGPSSQPSVPEQNTDKQSEKELLLSLDPNNPEHVSAYAETQGGLPVDVARKMLMIHQDAFIEQLKRDGMNVDQVSTQRGSRAQSSSPGSRREPTDGTGLSTAVQQPSPMQQVPPAQPVPPSSSPIEPPPSQSPNDIEYAEYHDVTQPGQNPGPNQQSGGQPVPLGNVDGQQVEMMKTFATDIGKVMGEMLNKIESLNNTVFTLQSEMNDMKKQGPKQSSSIHTGSWREPTAMAVGVSRLTVPTKSAISERSERIADTYEVGTGGELREHPEMPPRIPSYPPGMTDIPVARTPSSIPPPIIARRSAPVESPSLETFEDQEIESPKEELNIERSGDFFEENVIDVSNFKQELEEDAKVQETQQQTPPPGPVQPVVQPIPPVSAAQPVPSTVVQSALPTSHITEPVQVYQPPVVQIPDSKTSEENDDSFVTPTNEQLKLSKKVGIHKKAAYRNIKPSFKKNDGKENKEDSNINREV